MFEISRIMTPVVFSANCRGALRYAAGIASRFDAELTVLHVLEPLHRMDFDSAPCLQELEKARRDWVHRALTDLTFEMKPKVTVRDLCVEGDPATEIVRTAESSGTDLIVIATHGHGPFRRFLLGSVTAKVLHDSSCAVLTGAHLEQALAQKGTAGEDVRLVLCAVDFGAQIDAALEWSAGMASAYNATLALLHVVGPAHDPNRQRSSVQEALERLEHWSKMVKIDAEAHVAVGTVPDQVANEAQRLGAGVLVIGRGHMKGGGRLRSTSYTIIRESPCPVVSV